MNGTNRLRVNEERRVSFDTDIDPEQNLRAVYRAVIKWQLCREEGDTRPPVKPHLALEQQLMNLSKERDEKAHEAAKKRQAKKAGKGRRAREVEMRELPPLTLKDAVDYLITTSLSRQNQRTTEYNLYRKEQDRRRRERRDEEEAESNGKEEEDEPEHFTVSNNGSRQVCLQVCSVCLLFSFIFFCFVAYFPSS